MRANTFHVYISFNIVEMAANMYSEMREEARDHARLRNAYFEQVYHFFFLLSYCLNFSYFDPQGVL
jgi:hypothetical protein